MKLASYADNLISDAISQRSGSGVRCRSQNKINIIQFDSPNKSKTSEFAIDFIKKFLQLWSQYKALYYKPSQATQLR